MNRFLPIALAAAATFLLAVGALLLMKFLDVDGPNDTPDSQLEQAEQPERTGPRRPGIQAEVNPVVTMREEEELLPDPVEPTALEVQPGGVGTIVGEVVDADGQPVGEAQVRLSQGPAMLADTPSLMTPTDYESTTDSSGRFKLGRIPPADDYHVMIRHEQSGVATVSLNLKADSVHDVGTVRLRRGGQVHGFVRSNGWAIEGATVLLQSNLSGIGPTNRGDDVSNDQSTTTDADGYYAFATVAIKNYEVTAIAEGYGRQSKANRAFLTNEPEQEIDFDLTASTSITGSVVNERSQPIDGAKVFASLSGAAFRSEGEAITGPDGRFVIPDLAVGQYHLSATATGYSPSNKPKVPSGTANVDMVMLLQGGVSGTVIDELSGARLDNFTITVLRSFRGRDPAASGPSHKFSGSTGEFLVEGLDPNSYVLEARAAGYAPSRSEEFTTVRGETSHGIVVPMNRGGTVTGVVLDQEGEPLAGIQVSLNDNQFKWNPVHDILLRMSDTKPSMVRTRTDEEGRYRMEMVVPGVYQVTVKHRALSDAAVNDVVVEKNKETQVDPIRLRPGARVEGFCYDEERQPLAGAQVTAISKDQDYFTGRCDGDAHFIMGGLPPGEYQVSIQSYVSDPPENVLTQMIKCKNSAITLVVNDGDVLQVELQLATNN